MASNGQTKGVRINCEGDKKTFSSKPFVEVAVPQDHPAFMQPTAISVSEPLGFPLLAQKYPPNRAWEDTDMVPSPYQNVAATFLHLEMHTESAHWEWAPLQWQDDVGSVLLVRKDGKDLTPHQVEALCCYCQFEFSPAYEEASETDFEYTTKDDLRKLLTWESFAKFFENFKKEKAGEDESWATASLPPKA